MRVIDAHTGLDVHEGSVLPIPGDGSTPELSRKGIGIAGTYRVLKIEPGIWRAKILIESTDPSYNGWIPLTVRWTHPGFPLQHVAFIPS